ncbi:MAG TPA: biotin carboxylase N-terminal domain-containing protein [Thermoanaerobaculia bacterium]|nr:biotin carboxylase N-terminal domain-containing protein [Thermoanaerobaculia bacterium]
MSGGPAIRLPKRLLIANRGEIAIRVARTAREMGIATIGVYSESDAGAAHLAHVDDAEPLGAGGPSDTYLSIDHLVAVARASRADAVHPGYGFLSENAAFARAVEGAGLLWIGAPAGAIEAMGGKLAARQLMERAGVPVVPGTARERVVPGSVRAALSDRELIEESRRIGFPVLVKASAGGGGKGMSRVDRPEDLPAALEEGRRVAQAAFSDGTVYLERLLDGARHVEIQVFGDRFGAAAHLFERECSVQRRHQKIVEETPSPALTPELRAAMGAAAVAAARAVGYVGAGTVEFLLDASRRFYFLEMNTRLQVEHPITEETTGLDLVRAQIEIAAGTAIPREWTDGSLTQRGHAVEMRLYAEDPVDFLPRSGRLAVWREPSGPGVRVDAGVAEGTRVGVEYDPLLAKLIVHAKTRDEAIARARRALSEWLVLGVETNAPLLSDVLEAPEFLSGGYATDLVERIRSRAQPSEPPDVAWIAAALALSERGSGQTSSGGRTAGPPDPWDQTSGWRAGA